MTTSQTLPHITIRATATIPIDSAERPIRDDSARNRWFVADTLTINYLLTYADRGEAEEIDGPWEVTAIVSGLLITGGATGKRRASRTYHDDPVEGGPGLPEWIADYAQRYHPGKFA